MRGDEQSAQLGRGVLVTGITRPQLPRLSSSDSYLRLPLEWP